MRTHPCRLLWETSKVSKNQLMQTTRMIWEGQQQYQVITSSELGERKDKRVESGWGNSRSKVEVMGERGGVVELMPA